MNNLPKVVTQRCPKYDLNPRPIDRKSKLYPLRHQCHMYRINITATKLKGHADIDTQQGLLSTDTGSRTCKAQERHSLAQRLKRACVGRFMSTQTDKQLMRRSRLHGVNVQFAQVLRAEVHEDRPATGDDCDESQR